MVKLKTLNDMLTDEPDLLGFVTVPEGLDASYLKSAIIDRCGNVAPYYQQTGRFVVYGALWFATHTWLFDHALKIINSEYSPIENYNRTEELAETTSRSRETSGIDTNSGTDQRAVTRSNTTTDGGTTGRTGSITHGLTVTDGGTTGTSRSETKEHDISAFNSATYQDADQDTLTGLETVTHGKTQTQDGTDTETETTTHGKTQSEQGTLSDSFTHGHILEREGVEEESGTRENLNNIHGNIGVTTNQQMITEETRLLKSFAVYDFIASVFENDNFICVYDGRVDL